MTVQLRTKAAVIFDNLGPYHRARLEAVNDRCELLAIEVGATSREYGWESTARACRFRIVTLPGGRRRTVPSLKSALDSFRPEVVFVPGWSSVAAFCGLAWCLEQGSAAVAMCESSQRDVPRAAWREWVKRRIVRRCAAALAGGRLHADYLAQLGMPRHRVFLGYDAVDNGYFADGADAVRKNATEWRQRYGLPQKFFLASARFIQKKNLPRLIEAYRRYRSGAGDGGWGLVILGEGMLRPALESQLRELNGSVYLPGFKQYADLPAFYGLAGAFVHASTTEQWGLVVNEAMAAALPVLASSRCGCAPELVEQGRNGFGFDPYDVDVLAGLMTRVAGLTDEERTKMGRASREIISNWGPQRFAAGFQQACEAALEQPAPKATWVDRLLLHGLMLSAERGVRNQQSVCESVNQ